MSDTTTTPTLTTAPVSPHDPDFPRQTTVGDFPTMPVPDTIITPDTAPLCYVDMRKLPHEERGTASPESPSTSGMTMPPVRHPVPSIPNPPPPPAPTPLPQPAAPNADAPASVTDVGGGGLGPLMPAPRKPYKRGECKADIAVQRHELMQEVLKLKNELASVKHELDWARQQTEGLRRDWATVHGDWQTEKTRADALTSARARCWWCRWRQKGAK